jgi:hypothetical protein
MSGMIASTNWPKEIYWLRRPTINDWALPTVHQWERR